MMYSLKQIAGYVGCIFLLTCTIFVEAAESDFPVPDSIRPAIAFWIKVYTEVDTQSGYLHDPVNLNIIYEKLPRDSALIDSRRKAISADLEVLASGKRSGLSSSQQQLLEL